MGGERRDTSHEGFDASDTLHAMALRSQLLEMQSWRPRVPTAFEVRAHGQVYASGHEADVAMSLWQYRSVEGVIGVVTLWAETGEVQFAHRSISGVVEDGALDTLPALGWWWRPLSARGERVAWPSRELVMALYAASR